MYIIIKLYIYIFIHDSSSVEIHDMFKVRGQLDEGKADAT